MLAITAIVHWERQLPKLNVKGSSPFTRFCRPAQAGMQRPFLCF